MRSRAAAKARSPRGPRLPSLAAKTGTATAHRGPGGNSPPGLGRPHRLLLLRQPRPAAPVGRQKARKPPRSGAGEPPAPPADRQAAEPRACDFHPCARAAHAHTMQIRRSPRVARRVAMQMPGVRGETPRGTESSEAPAWQGRDEGAYWAYSTEEQRSPRGMHRRSNAAGLLPRAPRSHPHGSRSPRPARHGATGSRAGTG